MDHNNFREGSIEQIIFDYWDRKIDDAEFFKALMRSPKTVLVEFIQSCQGHGLFGNRYIHE
jgi:hypothetical protein